MIIREVKEIATFGDLPIGAVCLKDNVYYIKISDVMVGTNPIDAICNVLRLNDYLLDMIEDDEKVAVFDNVELLLK